MFRVRITAIFLIIAQILICGGKSGFNFLTIGVDARLISLGEAGVSKPSGIGAIYYNPANLSALRRGVVMFTYRNWMLDGKFFYGSAGLPGKHLNLALSLTSFTVSDIEIRHRPGEAEGKFSARNLSLALTASPNMKSKLKFGLTAKYIYEKIFIDEVQTITFDAGLLYDLSFARFNLNIGTSVRNIGFKGKYNNEIINPPTLIAFGASINYATGENTKFYLCVDTKHKLYEGINLFALGIGTDLFSMIELNIGYETGEQIRSTSFGLGFNFKNLTINYAFTPFKFQFPNSHTFTLEFKL